MRIVVVDHRDSFTWNLVHDLGELDGSEPLVVDAHKAGPDEVIAARPDLVVIGPGPGHPADPTDAGSSPATLRASLGRVPVFGVCFGMQLLAVDLGARVSRAAEIVHGKSVDVRHDHGPLFAGLPSPVAMMRYNSLAVERASLPPELRVAAEDARGEVMALAHAHLPAWGVQFHPESVGSPEGRRLIRNVLALARPIRASNSPG